MHFTTFIINAVTFAKIKSIRDRRRELERALLETREQLKQVARLTPLCPECRKPYVPEALSAQECLVATNPQPPGFSFSTSGAFSLIDETAQSAIRVIA